MKDKDYIQELFSQKLTNHEVPVRSDLWSGIQSQIGNTATTAASGGISVAAKWAIGIASSVIVASSVVWLSSDGDAEQKKDAQVAQVAQKGVEKAPEEEAAIINAASNDPDAAISSEIQKFGSVREEIKGKPFTDNFLQEAAGSKVNPNAVVLPVYSPDGKKVIGGKINLFEATSTGMQQSTPSPANSVQQPTAAASSAKNNAGTENAEKSGSSVKRDQQLVAGSAAAGEGTSSDAKQKPVVGSIEEWVNVFSPNGDSYNDNFELKTENLKDFSITVLNEKNQVIYTSDNPRFKWDGTDLKTGEMVPNGNYGYVVIARDTNGNLIKMFKNLTITR